MGHGIPQSNVPSSVADEAITKEMHNGLGRATTTASSLEAEQGSGNISKTQTKATPYGPSSPRTSLEGVPTCYVPIGDSSVLARPKMLSNLPNEPPLGEGDSPVLARPKMLSNLPNEPPLGEGNTSRSGEGCMQLLELMDLCTKLSGKVTALENELKSTKSVYNKALITLTKRVKKLEKKLKHRRRAVVDSSEDEKASLDQMIEEINEDKNTNLVKSSKQGEAHETASTASPQKDDDEETLVETIVSIKKSVAKDKGKAIMQESEPLKKIKKKEMI
uniref:Uncharacterized protein n=1 Tax=Tanacetum cinerariifolium TaxID=118510 RepID=A0A699L0W7_TANCI|nr:hypothetical protein [Tanacetum cinerariifolium]